MSRQVRLIGGKAHATYWTKDENPYYWNGDVLMATDFIPVPQEGRVPDYREYEASFRRKLSAALAASKEGQDA